MPMFGQIEATFSMIESSTRIDAVFFSVAITTPFDASLFFSIIVEIWVRTESKKKKSVIQGFQEGS
jgi:hypothetical protein